MPSGCCSGYFRARSQVIDNTPEAVRKHVSRDDRVADQQLGVPYLAVGRRQTGALFGAENVAVEIDCCFRPSTQR